MKKHRLAVSETFYSIQGEGITTGIPAVFLRLGGCNLLCESKNWRCDTIEVWRKSKSKDFADVLPQDYVDYLEKGAHLVITGGEPLMHQEQITEYLRWFLRRHKFMPTIEIETNGSIVPEYDLDMFVNHWNVSPKLSTAGEQNKKEVRINEQALRRLNDSDAKTIFKFVISCEEDINEMLTDFKGLISFNKIVLMPAGSSQEELSKTRDLVAEQCKKLKFRYSDRLHIVIWNLKTGV